MSTGDSSGPNKRVGITLTQHILSTQPKESKGEFTLLNVAIMTAIRIWIR